MDFPQCGNGGIKEGLDMHSVCFIVLKILFSGSALVLNKYKALRMLFGHILLLLLPLMEKNCTFECRFDLLR